MLRIRLRRVGAKHRPSYRLVVADSRAPRDGRTIDILGHYSPLDQPEKVVVNKEKAASWLGKGAQPSDTARRLLGVAGVMEPAPLKTSAAQAKKTQPSAKTTPEKP